MKDVSGRPGTKAGLCLRLGQCLFASITMGTMMYSMMHVLFNSFAYSYFTYFMGAQFVWSFLMACLDVYALTKGKDLRTTPRLFTIILIFDGVLSTLLLGATCSLAGVEIFFLYDLALPTTPHPGVYRRHSLYMGSAFICCFLSSLSAYVEFFNWPSIILGDE